MTSDERILEALSEVKQQLVGIDLSIQAQSARIQTQNGRIGKLEDWKLTMDLAAAKAVGVQEGRAGMVLSKKWIAAFAGFVTFAIGATGGIVAIVMDLQ